MRGKDTYIRLPAPDDPSFAEAYERAAKPGAPRVRRAPDSIAALVAEFRGSAEGKAGKEKTKGNRARYLDLLTIEHGHRTVKGLKAPHIYKMRDAMASTPGKANNWLSTLKLFSISDQFVPPDRTS